MEPVSTRMVVVCNLLVPIISAQEQTVQDDGEAHPFTRWQDVVAAADEHQASRRQYIKGANGKRIVLTPTLAQAASRASKRNNTLPAFGWNGTYITAIREEATEKGTAVKLKIRAGLDASIVRDIEAAEATLGKKATRNIQKQVATADMNSPLNEVLPAARQWLSVTAKSTSLGKLGADWETLRQMVQGVITSPEAS